MDGPGVSSLNLLLSIIQKTIESKKKNTWINKETGEIDLYGIEI